MLKGRTCWTQERQESRCRSVAALLEQRAGRRAPHKDNEGVLNAAAGPPSFKRDRRPAGLETYQV
jgi:hypothetical protein